MKKRWRIALSVAVATGVGIQFVPVERANPPVVHDLAAPAEVAAMLRAACYDCHSHETRWPWYARVAPVSWWLADHVAEGRRNLDFSAWPVVDFEAQDLALRGIATAVAARDMPPASYRLGHPEARLDAHQRAIIVDWARAASAGAD